MQYVSSFFKAFLLISFLSFYAHGSHRHDDKTTTCYRIDEKSMATVDQSPLILCLVTSDLERYPKSTVTVTLAKEELTDTQTDGRRIASLSSVKNKIIAKRYYTRLSKNHFGRKGEGVIRPGVNFDRKNEMVTLGFVGDDVKKYYYKPIAQPVTAYNDIN